MEQFRETVDAVRRRVNLEDLIGQDVELHRAGSVLKGRSPWRRDREPSFVVWPGTQTWKDFSGNSGEGGDCFDYVMKRDGVPFMQALLSLAAEAGVEISGASTQLSDTAAREMKERRSLSALMTEAADYWHRALSADIRERILRSHYGFTDETIDALKLGWADGGLFAHLTRDCGATEEEALSTGLFVRTASGRVVDFFQGRIVFPYWLRGRAVYFIARRTDRTPDAPWEEAKYKKQLLQSERHPYVSPLIQNDTFYNEDAARGCRSILVTEGVADCISAMQAGVPCISPVTVRFRRKDIPKLLKLTAGCAEVVVCNDSEESQAGEEGALDTALTLAKAGRAVRIATIPRPEGQDKIDVNALVAARGPEALKEVLARAVDPGSHLISRIPADAPAQTVSAAFGEILDAVACTDPVVRQGWLDLAKERFGIKGEALKALKARVFPSKNMARGESSASGRTFLSEVDGTYWAVDKSGAGKPISDFVFRPKRLVVLEDGEEAVETDIQTSSGRTMQGVQMSKRCWASRNALISSLRSVDTVWCGTDEQTQWLLHTIAGEGLPRVAGARTYGYRELNGVPYWVEPTRTLTANGEAPDGTLVFWNTGDDLSRRLRPLVPVPEAEERRMAAFVLPRLLKLNPADVMLPAIGWFFAAPLKPRIQKVIGHFPFLCVWGTQGSGKTSLIKDVFMPLMGVADSIPTSVTDTEFSLVRRLSASASIPAFLDEYKPGDMTSLQRGRLHRLLRRVYGGEAEYRGRPDLSVVRYDLSAPVCLCGETRPTEPALMERIITVCPDKASHGPGTEAAEAFRALQEADTGRLTRSLVQFLLSTDTTAVLAEARRRTGEIPGFQSLPGRVRDNLLAVVCGLIHFKGYAAKMGVFLPALDLRSLASTQSEDILDGKAESVKNGADQFLERLSDMAASGMIQRNCHYVRTQGNRWAIHLGSCLMAYRESCHRTQDVDEVVDRKMLVRQLKENMLSGGYVEELTRVVDFRGTKRRAVVLNLEKARAVGLEVDDFPWEEERSGYVRGRWEPD